MRDYHTFDLETDPFNGKDYPKAFCAGYFDGKTVTVFYSADCCKSVIALAVAEGKKRGGMLLIYAHNGGKFDFHFVLLEILQYFNKEDIELICIGSRIVSIKCPAFELRDSYSLIPKPLKAFGKKLDIEIWKLKATYEELTANEREKFIATLSALRLPNSVLQSALQSPRNFYREEIIKYLKQDCIGLHEGLTEFFTRYGCEITLASTAFNVGRKQFNVKPEKTGLNYDSKFRPFYFAGRVQFFGLGKHGQLDGQQRFKICDINSAFPWAMLSRHWFNSGYARRDSIPSMGKEQAFYEVECDSMGCLPLRAGNGGVDFPVGRFRFFATGWELFQGIELGLVKNVVYHSIYAPKETQEFSPYVNHFYELKKNAPNAWDRDFAKLFLNSYYGKYALNPREFRDVKITKWGEIPEDRRIEITPDAKFRVKRKKDDGNKSTEGYYIIDENEYEVTATGEIHKIKRWEHSYDDLQRGLSFWQCLSNDDESISPMSFYNVCTAASITGCVRAFLMRSLHSCGNVLYTDTDSCIAASTDRLLHGDELGQWKLEKECDAVWIGGKKLYAAHSRNDKGVLVKPSEFFRSVILPGFERYYLTKKDFDDSWKTACKGVRLSVEDIISVCEGEARSYSFEAPNYSVFSKPGFTTRRITRADKRKSA